MQCLKNITACNDKVNLNTRTVNVKCQNFLSCSVVGFEELFGTLQNVMSCQSEVAVMSSN